MGTFFSRAGARLKGRLWIHAALLVATLGTTFITYFVVFADGTSPTRAAHSLIFSVALVLILGAHEMGHYTLARIHKVDASLPYFIPLPFVGVGTLGAVIRIRSPMPNRNALVDIGSAGPLAGIAVAIPILFAGFALSTLGPSMVYSSHFPRDGSLWALGEKLWHYLANSPEAVGTATQSASLKMSWIFGDNLMMTIVQRLVWGKLPLGQDVYAHPLVIAGWFGILVTLLNLMPIGQLDGGHLTFALFGKHAQTFGRVIAAMLLNLCLFFSAGWLFWLIVSTQVIGFRHPPVTVPDVPLTRSRKWICALCGLVFVLCVMPVPLRQQ